MQYIFLVALVLLNLFATPVEAGSESYTAPGTYTFTVPAGVTQMDVTVVAGGGGGGGSQPFMSIPSPWAGAFGDGGGAGGFDTETIPVSPGDEFEVTVGKGGCGGFTSYDGFTVYASPCPFGYDEASGEWYAYNGQQGEISAIDSITNPGIRIEAWQGMGGEINNTDGGTAGGPTWSDWGSVEVFRQGEGANTDSDCTPMGGYNPEGIAGYGYGAGGNGAVYVGGPFTMPPCTSEVEAMSTNGGDGAVLITWTDPAPETVLPTVSAPVVSSITATSARLEVTIEDTSASIVERGTCWDLAENPSIADGGNCLVEGGLDDGLFTQERNALPSGTTIYATGFVRIGGSGLLIYSNDTSFVTLPAPYGAIVASELTVDSGATVDISWTSGNAASCIVYSLDDDNDDSWTALIENQTSSPLFQNTTYALVCDGTPLDAVTVYVNTTPELSANRQIVKEGDTITFSWDTHNLLSDCSLTGGEVNQTIPANPLDTAGTTDVVVEAQTTYTLSCETAPASGIYVTATTTINILPRGFEG